MYTLTGNEHIEESTEKVECGDMITTTYKVDDTIVRVDKTLNVDAVFMTKALQGQI